VHLHHARACLLVFGESNTNPMQRGQHAAGSRQQTSMDAEVWGSRSVLGPCGTHLQRAQRAQGGQVAAADEEPQRQLRGAQQDMYQPLELPQTPDGATHGRHAPWSREGAHASLFHIEDRQPTAHSRHANVTPSEAFWCMFSRISSRATDVHARQSSVLAAIANSLLRSAPLL